MHDMVTLGEISTALAALDQGVDDAVRIDRIRVLEELKSAVAAAQAREVVAFAVSQRAVQAAAGVKPEHRERGVSGQVGVGDADVSVSGAALRGVGLDLDDGVACDVC